MLFAMEGSIFILPPQQHIYHGCPSIVSATGKSVPIYEILQTTHPSIPAVPERRDSNIKANSESKSTNEDGRNKHACTPELFELLREIVAAPTVALHDSIIEGGGQLEYTESVLIATRWL
jgi:hypothetical protein